MILAIALAESNVDEVEGKVDGACFSSIPPLTNFLFNVRRGKSLPTSGGGMKAPFLVWSLGGVAYRRLFPLTFGNGASDRFC